MVLSYKSSYIGLSDPLKTIILYLVQLIYQIIVHSKENSWYERLLFNYVLYTFHHSFVTMPPLYSTIAVNGVHTSNLHSMKCYKEEEFLCGNQQCSITFCCFIMYHTELKDQVVSNPNNSP